MEETHNDKYLPKYFVYPNEKEKLIEYDKDKNITYILKPYIGT